MQKPPETTTFLLEGNETRRVGGTDTRSTVLDGLAVRLLVMVHEKVFDCDAHVSSIESRENVL